MTLLTQTAVLTDPATRNGAAGRSLDDVAAQMSSWLRQQALPLWSRQGFDRGRNTFEEQLDFAGQPVAVPRRTMVQARQIAVFAAAALSGRNPAGAELALRAARAWVPTHLAADGWPGWVFSVDHAGRVVDPRRDLYAHAFALFALAWVLRLERHFVFEQAVQATLDIIDGAFADPVGGGYWDCLPRRDALRRQNPHMHLFEAFLALWETTGRPDILERCRRLHALVLSRFTDMSRGVLREDFDDAWTVHPAPMLGRVEPGHLFEWAWLLRRYEAASGEDQTVPVSALIATAVRAGLDGARGRIIDEIDEAGRPRVISSRSWPHTEALKALSAEAARGDGNCAALLAPILRRIGDLYCRPDLYGGWVDHLDAADRPISKVMPASTMYHLYFGISAVEDLLAMMTRGETSERDGEKDLPRVASPAWDMYEVGKGEDADERRDLAYVGESANTVP